MYVELLCSLLHLAKRTAVIETSLLLLVEFSVGYVKPLILLLIPISP